MEETKFEEINSIINGFKGNYECKKCGNKQTVNLLPYIDFTKNPEYYAKVKDLSIFKVKCEKCGVEEIIKFDTLLFDETHKYFLYYLADKDMYNRFRHQITYFIETVLNKDGKFDLKDYKTRLVFNHNDLIEKMTIFELGLNDEVIELIKSGLFEKNLVNEVIYDSIYFDGMNNADLQFVSFNSRSASQPVQKLTINFNFYNKVIDELKVFSMRHKEYFEVIDKNWVNEKFKVNDK